MKRVLFFLLLSCSLPSQAQKLSPWLSQQVQGYVAASRSGVAPGVAKSKGVAPCVDVLVKFVAGADASAVLSAYGAEPLNTIGRVHIVRVPLSQVEALSLDDRVVRVEAERAPRPMLDRVPAQIGADKAASPSGTELPQAFTGRDVVVGIVDSGFDFLHPFFRDGNGTTRIGWAADYLADCKYTGTDSVTAAQHSSDASTMLHGTHVAGIAAGSRVNDVNDVFYSGIATEADIAEAAVDAVIRTDGSGLSSVTSLRAFADIFDYADGLQKPCVINYSMGDAMSFSDNRQLENEAIGTLLEKPGHILVVAAGNSGSAPRLVRKTADMEKAGAGVCFSADEQYGLYLGVELKVLPTQTVTLRTTNTTYTTASSETTVSAAELAAKTRLTLGRKSLTVVDRGETADGYRVVYITSGNNTFTARERVLVTVSGEGQAWLYADPLCAAFENVEQVENHALCSEAYAMTWPALLDDVVAVGNIAHRLKILTASDKYARRDSTDLTDYESTKGPGYIARSSSQGPTLDGTVKPDVCAPGVNVISALNNFINEDTEMAYAGWLISHMDTDYEEDYGYSMTLAQTGTSMSAPAVTGTIALWLQADPTLTTEQVKDIIAHSSRQPDATMAYPNNVYGHGEIDAYSGLLYMLGLTGIHGLSHHQPGALRFEVEGKTLTVKGDVKSGAEVRVYATDGRLVYNGTVQDTAAGQATVSLRHLPGGVYAVQINTGCSATTGSTLVRL